MADYIYSGSFPASPATNDTLTMNGVKYIYTTKGSWEVTDGVAAEGTAILSTGEGATKFLRADGDDTSSWQVPTDTTYSNFSGTTAGLVPTSTTTDDTKFLRADGTWVVPTDTTYTHPTHPGDDFSVDTTALTGATVVSDIDINVTTDTLGHVTDANGVISTRTLTLADLGYTGSATANNYTHPNHSGDVVSAADGAMTIQTDAVDIAMLSATGTASATTFLRGDNTWVVPTDTDTTYSIFAGTTAGLVPTSTTTDDTKFLRADGSWVVPTDTTYSAGTGLNLSSGTFNVDVGTTASKIIQLDGSAKLPAVDGSALTNLPGGGVNITSSATAPSSPNVGDQWFDTTDGILFAYMTDGTDSDWIDISSTNGLMAKSITSSATAPNSPSVGDQWFDIVDGILFAYMTDGTDSDWIDISSANGLAASSGGGGAMEFVSQTIITTSTASVTFTGLSASAYDRYVISYGDITTTGSLELYIKFKDSSDSYLTTNNTTIKQSVNNSPVFSSASGAGYLSTYLFALDSGSSIGGTLTILRGLKQFTNETFNTKSGTGSNGVARHNGRANGTIAGVELGFYSNSTSGTFTLYGIKDS
jgi:hypothetical protein